MTKGSAVSMDEATKILDVATELENHEWCDF